MPSEFLYPLDVTGKALSNRVALERQTLSAPAGNFDYHFILSKAGPYYRDSMRLRHITSGRLLIIGVDWFPGHLFKSASEETEYVEGGIYQSILFADRTLSGQVELISYNVLGGEWSLSEAKILEVLSNKATDPRQVVFEEVNGRPEVFPPIRHPHPVDDMIGMREMVESAYQISQAIRDRTANLPNELRVILEDYYTRSQVDKLLTDLAQQLLEGLAGDELTAIIQGALEGLIDDFYSKAQVDQFISDLQTLVDDRYTKAEVDAKFVGIATIEDINQAISNLATYDDLNLALQTIQEGAVSGEDVVALLAPLIAVDEAQQEEIDQLRQLIVNTGGSMDDYLRIEDVENYIPEPDYDATFYPAAEVVGITGDGTEFSIVTTAVSANISDGKIKTAELVIPSGGVMNIVPVNPIGGNIAQFEIDATVVPYDAVKDWDADGFVSPEEMWDDIKGNLVGFALRAETTYTEDDVTINYIVENVMKSDIEETIGSNTTNLYGPLRSTVSNNLLVSFLSYKDGAVKIVNYSNMSTLTVTEVKNIELDILDSITTLSATIDFRSNFGHDYISIVMGARIVDEEGTVLGICGYDHDHVPRVHNKVTIFKPPIDISAHGPDKKLRIEVKVNTRTLR